MARRRLRLMSAPRCSFALHCVTDAENLIRHLDRVSTLLAAVTTRRREREFMCMCMCVCIIVSCLMGMGVANALHLSLYAEMEQQTASDLVVRWCTYIDTDIFLACILVTVLISLLLNVLKKVFPSPANQLSTAYITFSFSSI